MHLVGWVFVVVCIDSLPFFCDGALWYRQNSQAVSYPGEVAITTCIQSATSDPVPRTPSGFSIWQHRLWYMIGI